MNKNNSKIQKSRRSNVISFINYASICQNFLWKSIHDENKQMKEEYRARTGNIICKFEALPSTLIKFASCEYTIIKLYNNSAYLSSNRTVHSH